VRIQFIVSVYTVMFLLSSPALAFDFTRIPDGEECIELIAEIKGGEMTGAYSETEKRPSNFFDVVVSGKVADDFGDLQKAVGSCTYLFYKDTKEYIIIRIDRDDKEYYPNADAGQEQVSQNLRKIAWHYDSTTSGIETIILKLLQALKRSTPIAFHAHAIGTSVQWQYTFF